MLGEENLPEQMMWQKEFKFVDEAHKSPYSYVERTSYISKAERLIQMTLVKEVGVSEMWEAERGLWRRRDFAGPTLTTFVRPDSFLLTL